MYIKAESQSQIKKEESLKQNYNYTENKMLHSKKKTEAYFFYYLQVNFFLIFR